MTIEYKQGNIIDSQQTILVNPVNCVGVMGAGLALQIKQTFPWSVDKYNHACATNTLQPGGLVASHNILLEKTIIHLATKDDWRKPSHIDYVKDGLFNLRTLLDRWNNINNTSYSIALPKLGCGRGGLQWQVVHVYIKKYFSTYNGSVHVYV